jgi:MFS family permease
MSDNPNAGGPSHSAQSSISQADSTASTLIASPNSLHFRSFDKHRKYSDSGQDLYAKSIDERRGGEIDFDNEDSGSSDQENERLLSNDGAALTSQTAATIDLRDGEPNLPLIKEKARQIAWSELPKKGQLAILTLARLSEPLTQQGLQSYMFYQLKSFKLPNGESPSDSTVASQAGILAAAFTGAQFLTAMMWGRLADSEAFGRKKVILIGLLGTAIGSLGFGFSKSFATAVFWRCLGGVLNGNIGVMRTMISEIVREKKFQSRAFLLMPMTFNIGVIVGPLLGGWLADPAESYPGIFGPGGSLGGKEGVKWLTEFPYALPNVINACFLFGSAVGILFGLEETLEALRQKPDYPLQFRRWVLRALTGSRPSHEYSPVLDTSFTASAGDVELQTSNQPEAKSDPQPKVRRRLPFRRIWTRNVVLTFISHGLLAMHVGTFNNLWFVFLSTPRFDSRDTHNKHGLTLPPKYKPHAPFTFTGGLALPPPSIGTALAILGVIGISMQLLLFPTLSFKLGTTRSFRMSLLLFPITYLIAPYLAVIPSSTKPPEQASGAWVWLGITLVLAIQVTARTFALPATAILVNNCCPHPSVLGSVHGIAQSVSSLTRTVGPVLAGWLYGVGLNKGMVGLAWWCMLCVALVGAVAGRFVREGRGHEVLLEGEEEEKEEEGEGEVSRGTKF